MLFIIFVFSELSLLLVLRCEMPLALEKAYGNAAIAVRIYQQKYPNCRVPCAKTFLTVVRRIRENGTIIPVNVIRILLLAETLNWKNRF